MLNRHWFSRAAKQKHCHRNSVLALKWIGFALRSTDAELEVSIKPEILRELRSQIASAVKCNVISRKDLQRPAGGANHVAGMIRVWRPFLQELWGALASDGGNAPPNCIWISQIKSVLAWLDLFLRGVRGTLVRTFSLDTWSNVAQPILITLDASPWGLGGIIEVSPLRRGFSNPRPHHWRGVWPASVGVLICFGGTPGLPWCCVSSRHVRLPSVCLRENWLWILQKVFTSQASQQCTLVVSQIRLPIGCLAKQPVVEQAIDQRFFNSLQKL